MSENTLHPLETSETPGPPERWIALEDVSLVRSRRLILDGIHWSIAPGTHWVVLGANGSGKTTLLMVLAGYHWPTRGRVTVLGRRFGEIDLRELRKDIGWVGSFLQAQIPSNQKPLDLIVSGRYAAVGRIFQQPTAEDRELAGNLAERLECSNILESSYGVLSQGEKQRLLIARALMARPRLLILDEPCAGLDLVAREKLLRSLERLGRAPDCPTFVFVTHHLEEIIPVISHVLVLKDGRVLAQGPKDEVLTSPVLSRAFGISIEVARENGRFRAWAAGGAGFFLS